MRSFAWRMISFLWVVITILFVYSPVIVMIFFSFGEGDTFSGWEGYSLKWYKTFFTSEDMLNAVKGSLLVGLGATICSVILSFLIVVATHWWNPWWLLQSFILNASVPEIFFAVIILSVFSFWHLPKGMLSLISGHTLLGFGVAVPMIHAAFKDISNSLIDASFDLGATYWQTIWHVLLPVLYPVLIAAGFMVFAVSMDDFFVSFFCSGCGCPTISTYVYTTIRAYVDPSLNALSATLFVFSFLLVIIFVLPKGLDRIINDD